MAIIILSFLVMAYIMIKYNISISIIDNLVADIQTI